MILTRPADDEIETIFLHPHDDLLDQHADNTFARGYCRPFRAPGALDVGSEPQQRLPVPVGLLISLGLWWRGWLPHSFPQGEPLLEVDDREALEAEINEAKRRG